MTTSLVNFKSGVELRELEQRNLEKRELIKRTVCAGYISDDEFELFLHTCKRTGLDPLMKQIYSIPRGASRSTQTGIDGFRLIAERSGKYAPGQDAVYEYDTAGNVTRATAFVKKMTPDGVWHEITGSVSMQEYRPEKPSTFWKKMPEVMLSKCAEARALRKAFPADLGGIYIHEEMAQAGKTIEVEETSSEEKPAEILQHVERQETDLAKLANEVIKILVDNCKCEQILPEDMLAYLENWKSKIELFPRLNDMLGNKNGRAKLLAHFSDWLRKNYSMGNH